MISRLSFAMAAAILGVLLCAPTAPAQGRGGMHAPAAAARARSGIGITGRNVEDRQIRRRFFNNSAFWFPPYFYPDGDDYDYENDYPVPPVVQPIVAQPVQSATLPAPAIPAQPLLLENHNGAWVRVPTGSEMPVAPTSALANPKPDSASTPNSRAGFVELPAAAAPAPPLPPAVIVFRDGHTEDVAKYMIQGQDLYTMADYYATGSWTRKIPLAELDIPASLKLNKERGTKFNLPSSPNEVMIRF